MLLMCVTENDYFFVLSNITQSKRDVATLDCFSFCRSEKKLLERVREKRDMYITFDCLPCQSFDLFLNFASILKGNISSNMLGWTL